MKSRIQPIMKFVLLLALMPALAAQATVRYVALDGSGSNGQSWATAYKTIGAALQDSAIGSGDEIWVKQGTYRLGIAIQVQKAARLYGGFSGVGSTRDSQAYVTTLDGGDFASCLQVTASAHIDGFTFTNGYAWGAAADQSGGGVYIASSSPTIVNCRFYRNHADYMGGGIAADNANGATISNCVFEKNTANVYGGGIYTRRSNLTVTGCTFKANECNHVDSEFGGGGMYNEDGAPIVDDCVFTANGAYVGAGMCNNFANTRVQECIFADCNSVTTAGGGLYNHGGSPFIRDCVFSSNVVSDTGAAVWDRSTATFVNCIMADNYAYRYGGGVFIESTDMGATSGARFTNCTMYGNSATRGGGLYSSNASATLTNCILWGNEVLLTNPGIHNNTMLFPAETVANYCDIQGDSTYPGTGNLRVDPGFSNPDYDDFTLPFGSPCIDVGNNSAPGITSYDFDGKPRVVDGDEDGAAMVDMGAFEYRGRFVSDYLYRMQIAQGKAYDSPSDAAPANTFLMELQTADNVTNVQFHTPGGQTYTISSAPHASSTYVDTYHQVTGTTHIWTYMAEFALSPPLADYGDGEYTVTLYYTDGTTHQTAFWYGVPGSSTTLTMPTQKPNIIDPTYGGGAGSPVMVSWDAASGINTIFLAIIDPGSGQDVVVDTLAGHATSSNAYTLNEGAYDAELSFENAYEVTNADGIPFAYGKGVSMGHEFEVLYTAVYRFWSPITSKHFYTVSERERDKLIDNYADAWTYEGPVFKTCATQHNSNLVPVYRFWSGRLGSHFYTISEAEKDKLITQFDYTWTYEGPVFYAYPEGKQPAECKPVYRFWSPTEGGHFYTMSETEKDKIINQYAAVYIFEGIAFYAYE